MAGKAHVNDFRKATEKDLGDLDVFTVTVPIYNKEIIESQKLRDVKTLAGFTAIMRKMDARNIETKEANATDEWVDLDSLVVDETKYTNVANCNVTVMGFYNGRTVCMDGELYGQKEDIIALKTKNGSIWLCPSQSKCWFFD